MNRNITGETVLAYAKLGSALVNADGDIISALINMIETLPEDLRREFYDNATVMERASLSKDKQLKVASFVFVPSATMRGWWAPKDLAITKKDKIIEQLERDEMIRLSEQVIPMPCPAGHDVKRKDGPCRDVYCACPCITCRRDCAEERK